jgi:hypothetical protein
MDFTFYGDLLGTGAAYQLGATVAYERLNNYYNSVFELLRPFQAEQRRVKINMFSDSMLVWGTAPTERLLGVLQDVYLTLLSKDLLIRGAIVEDALQEDPRLEGPDFQKFLPSNDTLARAVGLEKTQEGARCLVSAALAQRILASFPEWLTVEGYARHPYPRVPPESILRRLCPTPSGSSYEMLYFWRASPDLIDYSAEKSRLRDIRRFYTGGTVAHFRETEDLVRRSELRDLQGRGRRGHVAV